MVTVNKNLKKFREEKGVCVKEMAKWIGVSPTTISSWESGKTKPNLEYMLRIAIFFDVKISQLIDD